MTRSELESWSRDDHELLEAWAAAWSGHDQRAFRRVCAPGVGYEDPFTAQPLEGVDALGAHAARLWDAFPDARLEPLGAPVIADGLACAPVRLYGTNRRPLGSLPASGRFVVLPIVFYCELAKGRLERVRAFLDVYDAGVQLGILPARGTLGSKALLMLRGFGLRARR